MQEVVIKLKDLLLEAYGTYTANAQNKALKRVGKKYGSTGKVTSPKIEIPKFKMPKITIPKIDISKLQKASKEKSKRLNKLYGSSERKQNIVDGMDVIKDKKDLEHFLYDFDKKGNVVKDLIAYDKDMDGQYAKQKEKLSPKERKQLEKDAMGWKQLGGYEAIQQAIKNGDVSERDIRDRNKRISDISHKTVTKVKQPIERGLEIEAKDAKQFLSRFKVGEDIEIPDESGNGASGFSVDRNVARNFSRADNSDAGMVSITLSIEPNSKGELRGLYVDGENKEHSSEAEITRSSKSKAKVKEVKKIKHPNGKMQYIVIMQEPDDLTTESLQYEATETTDDLSRKYLEGPLNSKPRKSVKEGMIKLKDLLLEGFDKQSVVDKVYPQIVKNLGRARRGIPKVEFHSNIYVRITGIEGMQGEANPYAEYDWDKNKIYLYTPKMINEEQIIKALLHEYTHATQDKKKMEKYRELGYDKNPYEKAASRAEKYWRKYI